MNDEFFKFENVFTLHQPVIPCGVCTASMVGKIFQYGNRERPRQKPRLINRYRTTGPQL